MEKNRYRRFVFTGFSMYPQLRPGDIIVAKQIPSSDITPGLILCRDDRERRIVHRVLHVEPSGSDIVIVLKGDNMPRADMPVLIPGDSCWHVSLVIRNGTFRKPRQGRISSFLCARNLTVGIWMGRVKRILRWLPSPIYNLIYQYKQDRHHDGTK